MNLQNESIVILGAGGMLAGALEDHLKNLAIPFLAFPENQLDITDFHRLRSRLLEAKPTIIINTAAYTDVDGCEENTDLAFAVNSTGAGNVARVSAELDAKLVHISTDYVFNGEKSSPYEPSDPPDPWSIYGKSKLGGEKAVTSSCDKFLVLRTSWLFGPWGKNFVQTMLNLADTKQAIKVVNDQRGCPTYTLDLAKALMDLVQSGLVGTHHLTNAGNCTWYEFAATIFRLAGKDVGLTPVTTQEFPRPAPRPVYSILDCSSTIESLGYPLPSWKSAVKSYLNKYLL